MSSTVGDVYLAGGDEEVVFKIKRIYSSMIANKGIAHELL